MDWLIWIGAALAVAGLAGLGRCIAVAWGAKRAGLEGAEMEARLRGLVALNLGSLMLAAFGLVLVVVGVALA
jgi:hypothetical protein